MLSTEIPKSDIMNAYLNPVVSRQMMLKIKNNATGFVLEPFPPEFVERQRGLSRASESAKWRNRASLKSENINLPVPPSPDMPSQPSPVEPKEPVNEKEDESKWIAVHNNQKFGPFTTAELDDFLEKHVHDKRVIIKNTFENKIFTYDYYLKIQKGEIVENPGNFNMRRPSEFAKDEEDDNSHDFSMEEQEQVRRRKTEIQQPMRDGPKRLSVYDNQLQIPGVNNMMDIKQQISQEEIANKRNFALNPTDKKKQNEAEQRDFKFHPLTGQFSLVQKPGLNERGDKRSQQQFPGNNDQSFSDDDNDANNNLRYNEQFNPGQYPMGNQGNNNQNPHSYRGAPDRNNNLQDNYGNANHNFAPSYNFPPTTNTNQQGTTASSYEARIRGRQNSAQVGSLNSNPPFNPNSDYSGPNMSDFIYKPQNLPGKRSFKAPGDILNKSSDESDHSQGEADEQTDNNAPNPQNDPYFLIKELTKKNNDIKKTNVERLQTDINKLNLSGNQSNPTTNQPQQRIKADAPVNPNISAAQNYLARIHGNKRPSDASSIQQNPSYNVDQQFSNNNIPNFYQNNNFQDQQNFSNDAMNNFQQQSQAPQSNTANSYMQNIMRANRPSQNNNVQDQSNPYMNMPTEKPLNEQGGKFIEEVYLSKDLKKAKEGYNYPELKLGNVFEKDNIAIPKGYENPQNHNNQFMGGNSGRYENMYEGSQNNYNYKNDPVNFQGSSSILNNYTNAIKKGGNSKQNLDQPPQQSYGQTNNQQTSSNYISRMQQMNQQNLPKQQDQNPMSMGNRFSDPYAQPFNNNMNSQSINNSQGNYNPAEYNQQGDRYGESREDQERFSPYDRPNAYYGNNPGNYNQQGSYGKPNQQFQNSTNPSYNPYAQNNINYDQQNNRSEMKSQQGYGNSGYPPQNKDTNQNKETGYYNYKNLESEYSSDQGQNAYKSREGDFEGRDSNNRGVNNNNKNKKPKPKESGQNPTKPRKDKDYGQPKKGDYY